MAVDFRCEKCGKLLSLDAQPGAEVSCPGCEAKLTVPEGLASLPHPQVPKANGKHSTPAGANAGPPPPADDEELEEEELEQGEGIMAAMAYIMPAVVSLFFHLGLFLIFALIAMIVITKKIPENITVPDAALSPNPGGVINPGESNPEMQAQQPKPTDQRHHSRRESSVPADTGKTDEKIQVIGVGAGGQSGGALAAFGLNTGGSGAGPKASFFGSGGNAHHIVYVVDRSGSMIDTFEFVKREILKSVSRLQEVQDFHVILFADGPPIENTPKRLVPAQYAYKDELAQWIADKRPSGQTDPVPALERAFSVLAKADESRPGKLIYLLTDGVFPDNDAVLKAIRARNRGKKILINTFLYGARPAEAEDVMKEIAQQNGGRYTYVSSDF
jgi:DNA-directed RNA polymerase subunit RPC12/RpoP